eukprot:355872-Chlamydomonas_euryale.AAC.2
MSPLPPSPPPTHTNACPSSLRARERAPPPCNSHTTRRTCPASMRIAWSSRAIASSRLRTALPSALPAPSSASSSRSAASCADVPSDSCRMSSARPVATDSNSPETLPVYTSSAAMSTWPLGGGNRHVCGGGEGRRGAWEARSYISSRVGVIRCRVTLVRKCFEGRCVYVYGSHSLGMYSSHSLGMDSMCVVKTRNPACEVCDRLPGAAVGQGLGPIYGTLCNVLIWRQKMWQILRPEKSVEQ